MTSSYSVEYMPYFEYKTLSLWFLRFFLLNISVADVYEKIPPPKTENISEEISHMEKKARLKD